MHNMEVQRTAASVMFLLYVSSICECQELSWIETPGEIKKQIGSSAEFNWTLETNGLDIISIDWRNEEGLRVMYKGSGKPTNGSGDYEGRVEYFSNAGLKIHNLKMSDSGIYTCKVYDENGFYVEDASPPMTLYDTEDDLSAIFHLRDSEEKIKENMTNVIPLTIVHVNVPVMKNYPPSVSVEIEGKYENSTYSSLHKCQNWTETDCKYNFTVESKQGEMLCIRVRTDHPLFEVEEYVQCLGITDPCAPSPCENGGSCVPTGNSYVCNCTSNYEGENCWKIIPDPCASNPCQNNGTCVAPHGDSYTCNCTSNNEGENCERTKPVSDNLEWWKILLIVLAALLFVGGIIAAILYFFCRDKIKQVREDQKDTTNEKNRSAQHSNHKESQEVTLDINSEPEPESESDMAPRSHGLISKQPPTDMKMQKLEASESHPHADTPMSGPLH